MASMNLRDQFGEAKQKLDDLLYQSDAVLEADLRSALGVRTTGKSILNLQDCTAPIEVFMTSVVKGKGVSEAFEWFKSNNS